MATGDALSADGVTIWIEAADVLGAALTNNFEAEVTNFDVSGGETDTEAIAVFGGGNIDKTKPTSQLEISMDVVLRYGSTVDQWDALTGAKMIAIQAEDGTNYYWNAWNNVKIVNFDKEFSAEDEWRGTMSFKVSPTDAAGTSNVQYGKADIATDLSAW